MNAWTIVKWVLGHWRMIGEFIGTAAELVLMIEDKDLDGPDKKVAVVSMLMQEFSSHGEWFIETITQLVFAILRTEGKI